jgi:hypothetical protein
LHRSGKEQGVSTHTLCQISGRDIARIMHAL